MDMRILQKVEELDQKDFTDSEGELLTRSVLKT